MSIHLLPICLRHLQHHRLNYPVLKQSSGPTPSDSLEERLGKAKSSDVAQFIPQCSNLFNLLLQYHHGAGNPYFYKKKLVKIVQKGVMFKVVSIENLLSQFLCICEGLIRNIRAERSLFFSPFCLLFNPKPGD